MEHNPIFNTKEDAEKVLEAMRDMAERYSEVSIQDLNCLVGRRYTYQDHKLGWRAPDLVEVEIRVSEQGHVLELPMEQCLVDFQIARLSEEIAEKVMKKLESTTTNPYTRKLG